MEGDLTSPVHCGLIPRMCRSIFNTLDESKTDFSVKISAVELYNERFFECLEDEEVQKKESTKVIKVMDGDLQNAADPLVENSIDVMRYLKKAQQSRKV